MIFARSFTLSLLSVTSIAPSVLGAAILRRAKPVALSQAEIDAFTPITFLASAAACAPAATANWSCKPCQANADVIPTASGGDGASVQFWYVGFSPSFNSVVVGHQGTDFSKIEAVITDANVIREKPDAALFPGLPDSVEASSGFLDAHKRAAPDVLAAVRTTIAAHNSTNIILSSHSLGAALSLLDAVMFKQQIPGANIKFVGYGMPRVGNQEFADFVDANIPDVTRIVNRKDPVPILPGRFLGFRHPAGEIHIGDQSQFLRCDGQESEEDGCTIDAERFVFQSDKDNHSGPYGQFNIGCGQAPP